MIRKWFFTLSEASLDRKDHGWRGLVRVAVRSAMLNTNLVPHLVYDGGENPFIAELRDLGVIAIRHRVSFYDKLARRAGTDPDYLKICSAVFLRVEIPRLVTDEDYVLYTDCDVMFLGQPDLGGVRPKTFAAAPQTDPADYRNDMNTGVMVMNLPALRKDLPAFTRFIVDHLDDGWPGCDQENYRRFYDGNWSHLPLEMNWKPYWGENENASIVHWHGPKPGLVRLMQEQSPSPEPDIMRRLFETNVAGYEAFLRHWDRLATGNPRSLIGHIDVVSPDLVAGWALYEDYPNEPAEIHLWHDGRRIGQFDCAGCREDIEALYGVRVGGFSFQPSDVFNEGFSGIVALRDAAGRPVQLKLGGTPRDSFPCAIASRPAHCHAC